MSVSDDFVCCEFCGRLVRPSKIAYTQVFERMRPAIPIAHTVLPPCPVYRAAITHRKCKELFRVVVDAREAFGG